MATRGTSGSPVPQLVLRVDPDELEVLLAVGQPFSPSQAGRDRVRALLTDDPGGKQIEEVVIDSYRLYAPMKLVAQLDSRA